jgi:retinol dehydrogenase-12
MAVAPSTSGSIMRGRVCLVTGATNGVGRVTALELAARGATVIAVGRDPERIRRTVDEIRHRTPHAIVEGLMTDLSSQREIRLLAQQVAAHYPRLDVLVNNAGAMFLQRQVSVDGIEATLALNHLGYFLLTTLLLPLLTASGVPGATARIVNVASEAHRRGRMTFDDLQRQRRYIPFIVYAQSKLMNVLFTYELARRLQQNAAAVQVTVNCLHPGLVASGFYDGRRGWLRAIYPVMRPFMIDADRGAATQVYLASSPGVEGVSGKYFDRQRERRSSRASYDRLAAGRLWDVSEQLVSASALPAAEAR